MLTDSPDHPTESMTRHQRLLAAVWGNPVDRPPVTAWLHFGSEHLSPSEVATLHRKFYQTYAWDFIKVMADYRFAVPDELGFTTRAQLRKLHAPKPNDACFRKQIECLKYLQDSVGNDVPLFDSGYDPYQMLLRHIGRDQAANLWRHTDIVLAFLDRLSDAIIAHIATLKELGVTGYFYSTDAASPASTSRGMEEEISERFVRPYNLRILEAAHGLVRILHAHGTSIELQRLSSYPFEVIHLSDRDKTNPTLSRAREWSGRCVMGGIDEARFSSVSNQVLAEQIDDAITQTEGRSFILAPGCVVPPSSSSRSLSFIRKYIMRDAVIPCSEQIHA